MLFNLQLMVSRKTSSVIESFFKACTKGLERTDFVSSPLLACQSVNVLLWWNEWHEHIGICRSIFICKRIGVGIKFEKNN